MPEHFIRFPLTNGGAVEIRITRPLSKADFDRIKAMIELAEDSIVEPDAPPAVTVNDAHTIIGSIT